MPLTRLADQGPVVHELVGTGIDPGAAWLSCCSDQLAAVSVGASPHGLDPGVLSAAVGLG